MATWVNIKTTDYNGAYDNEGVKITLQYDKDSSTAKALKLRLYATSTSSNNNRYYVLWKPSKGGSGERLFLIKGAGSKAATNSNIITIEKTYTDSKFVIPEYWLIHTGAMAPWKNTDKNDRWYITYYNESTGKNQSESLWKFFESETDWWTNSRRKFKTVVSKQEFKATKDNGLLATAVGAGSVSITDNFNNSYTVEGTGGSAGTNNAVTEAKLTYTSVKIANGVETVYTAEEDCNGKTVKKTVKFTPTSKSNTRQVTAKVDTKGTYNDPTAVSQTLAVKQYVAPGALSSPPTITSPDLTKTRLTNKKNWVFSWGAATAANDNSPVKGYRVYLYKKSAGDTKFVPATIYGHNLIPKEYYDTTNKSLTIYPLASNIDKYNFKPGDSVLLGVRPYTQYGNHNLGEKLLGTIEYSNYPNGYEVKNAGVVKVKTSGGWKEGQVYVKTSGGWKEAESVQIKTDKGWKESE